LRGWEELESDLLLAAGSRIQRAAVDITAEWPEDISVCCGLQLLRGTASQTMIAGLWLGLRCLHTTGQVQDRCVSQTIREMG
jgi:hypothetical protein